MTVAIARQSAYFGQGSGLVHIDSVQCTGLESELQNCTYSQTTNCGHSQDVGVTCNSKYDHAYNFNFHTNIRLLVVCNEGDVRLIGGSNESVGRVEVCVDDMWGTVCSNSWDSTDGGVICSQLGYSRYSGSTYFTDTALVDNYMVCL